MKMLSIRLDNDTFLMTAEYAAEIKTLLDNYDETYAQTVVISAQWYTPPAAKSIGFRLCNHRYSLTKRPRSYKLTKAQRTELAERCQQVVDGSDAAFEIGWKITVTALDEAEAM